ncbi:MAG: hypothetical protein JSV36_11110 [Anaerolineae bacterium]|nr:MAG: hypothetical protein JSV36_11110 [Anaerolineae bacterium]
MLPSSWPRWTIIFIALALIAFSIGVALALEPLAQAVSPELMPTPTVHRIAYALQVSGGCQDCHFDRAALAASAEAGIDVEAMWIERESLAMVHGRLGCVTCHGGNGETEDKAAAHEGLILDLSASRHRDCITCHTDLPDAIPGDRLRVPHGMVADRIQHDESCDVSCSDCHGAVGHGFDPLSGEVICSMTVCLDCHQERKLEIQMTDCDACHIGPHDVSSGLACDGCHTSAAKWSTIEAIIHPKLVGHGKHAEILCFECHTWPDFHDLHGFDCVDCHIPGHTRPADTDCVKCHDIGINWELTDVAAVDHTEFWGYHQGAHALVDCRGCHLDGRYLGSQDADCSNCHALDKEMCNPDQACTDCHRSDKSWSDVQD